MNNQKPAIQSIREVQLVNPDSGRIEPYMAVTFKVGNHGPFQENFLKATFDANQVNTRLQDWCSKLAMVQGQ